MKLMINRTRATKYQTLGYFVLFSGDVPVLTGNTLELPWKDNKKEKSCIPAGEYVAKMTWSPKFGRMLLEILDVEERTEIRIHAGSFKKNTLGCPLVGNMYVDIDGDGKLDMKNSQKTLQHLHGYVEELNEIEVIIS